MIARFAMLVLAAFFLLGLTCEEKESLFFTLIGGGTVPGTGDITGAVTVDGSPRSGVAVTLRNQAGQVVATDVTNASGAYGFLDVDPGSYTVSIAAPSGTTCDPSQKPATVAEDQTTTVNFGCATPQPTTGTLTVTVTVGGSPASGATVQITHSGGSRTGTTDPSGVARFENLDPGQYTVTTTLTGHSCGAGSGTVVAGQTVNVPVTCTQQQQTVPTTMQNQGSWNYMRSRTSTTGSCTPALSSTGSGSMTAQSATQLGVAGLDPDVVLSGPYNMSTGAYTGSGSTILPNGFTINTTLNATFSFDGSQNPRYTDVMVRMHVFGGSTVCTENYTTSGSRAVASSARFKWGMTALLPDEVTILGLRPVSFRYRSPWGDPREIRVGLVAEEVARLFPEAVARDESGRPAGIWYDRLNGLLIEDVKARIEREVDAAVVRLAKRL